MPVMHALHAVGTLPSEATFFSLSKLMLKVMHEMQERSWKNIWQYILHFQWLRSLSSYTNLEMVLFFWSERIQFGKNKWLFLKLILHVLFMRMGTNSFITPCGRAWNADCKKSMTSKSIFIYNIFIRSLPHGEPRGMNEHFLEFFCCW